LSDPKKKENGQGNTPEKSKRPRKHTFIKSIAVIIMFGIIIGCTGACILTIITFDILNNYSEELDLDAQKLLYTTIFYAQSSKTGEYYELQRISSVDGNRIWVDVENMPDYLLNAAIAVEDKRYLSHVGVDWQRTFLSGINYFMKKMGMKGIYEGTPGGSTITMQVVRNITADREISESRKLREMLRALYLEKHYSKEQILETYLNLVSFSNNTKGVQAAANLFFGKDVSELTVAECASIVGTTQNPQLYNPFINLENNLKRKDDVLYFMYEQNMLSQAEYEEALAQELVFTDGAATASQKTQSFFMDYVIEEVINDLMEEKGYTYAEANSKLLSGGYRIYTTVDETVQSAIEEVYSSLDNFPAVLNEEYPESAFLITDTHGAIKGMVGSNRPKEGARVWNRAADSKRQPGSTIKPISSYVLSVENDLIHWSTLIEDKPLKVEIGYGMPDWEPKNYYNHFKGYMTVNEALQRSTNMVPIQLTQLLTPQYMYNFLKNDLNMTSLTETDAAYSPMSLGALTDGVTLLEMAGAYQMFANGGTYTEPHAYTRVLDSSGNVVLEKNTVPARVISFETATVMNQLLQKVVTGAWGTGVSAHFSNSIPVGGKTGTTDDEVDQWFVGITPYYVGVCWMGYDSIIVLGEDGKPVYDSNGNTIPNGIRYNAYPPPILWKTVMKKVHEGLDAKSFQNSSTVIAVQYCAETGYAACANCETVYTGWYKSTNVPTTCPMHSGVDTDIVYHYLGEKTPVEEDENKDEQTEENDPPDTPAVPTNPFENRDGVQVETLP